MKPRARGVRIVSNLEGFSIAIGSISIIAYYDEPSDDIKPCEDGWLQLEFYDFKLFGP